MSRKRPSTGGKGASNNSIFFRPTQPLIVGHVRYGRGGVFPCSAGGAPMTYNLITIPAGFSTQKSYIKWMATVEVDNGFGAPGATFHRQTPPLTGKVKEIVQPHSKGGVVKLNISVNYRLFKLVDGPMNQQFPEEVESDMFWFGCEWPYNYSKDQLVFAPFDKYTMPISRGFKLLQGSCEEV